MTKQNRYSAIIAAIFDRHYHEGLESVEFERSSLIPRAVAAQFMADDIIAMFELVIEDDDVRIRQERHYRLVSAEEITDEDLVSYQM